MKKRYIFNHLSDKEYGIPDYISFLSYDVVSGSEITPCNKIDKPLVVYIFSGNVMTSITTCVHNDTIVMFLWQK